MSQELKKPASTDPIRTYDPYLAAIDSKGNHPHFRGGYKIWPDSKRVNQAEHRLMCIGNSTSLWPSAAWSLHLGKSLLNKGHKIAIYNGAGKGNSSSQELMRVIRDTVGIRPTLIVSLSGICDIGYLQNAKNQPFSHKYTRRVLSTLRDNGMIKEIIYGYPDPSTPAQAWCRNQSLMAIIAQAIGAQFTTLLQPVQGYGSYPATSEEQAFYAEKAKVVLKAIDKPYGICVADFYTEVKEIMAAQPAQFQHVIDFTDVFATVPGAFRDHRHQTEEGVAHLARTIEPIVTNLMTQRAGPSKPKAVASVPVVKPTSDKIGLYDPLMGSVSPRARWGNTAGGYKIWPEDNNQSDTADLRIMSMGNSTSLWPSAAWSLELGELLQAAPASPKIAVFNGAGKGNTSSQELMRVMRDAPGIDPHLIISLSGICDIGYLQNAKNQPFSHKYTRKISNYINRTDLVSDVVYGYPRHDTPAQAWCYNQRMIRALATEQGVHVLTFLQPVQGFGTYKQTPEEIELLTQKGKVVLSGSKKPYLECVLDFYTEVFDIIKKNPDSYSHIVDLTDAFADCPGAYRDHRHQSPLGVTHLARKIEPIVRARLNIS